MRGKSNAVKLEDKEEREELEIIQEHMMVSRVFDLSHFTFSVSTPYIDRAWKEFYAVLRKWRKQCSKCEWKGAENVNIKKCPTCGFNAYFQPIGKRKIIDKGRDGKVRISEYDPDK